jgi:hypothetical protein
MEGRHRGADGSTAITMLVAEESGQRRDTVSQRLSLKARCCGSLRIAEASYAEYGVESHAIDENCVVLLQVDRRRDVVVLIPLIALEPPEFT